MIYKIKLHNEAADDLYDLAFVIRENYHAPLTAQKYTKELFDTINSLKIFPAAFPVCTQKSVLEHYGHTTRRINYKKKAILYTIVNNTVVVLRIIPANTIT